MDQNELPLLEKIQQVYVLEETYQLLLEKLKSISHDDQDAKSIVREDLYKIEKELQNYGNLKVDDDKLKLNKELIIPINRIE